MEGDVVEMIKGILVMNFVGEFLFMFFVVAVFLVIGEELLFRGII